MTTTTITAPNTTTCPRCNGNGTYHYLKEATTVCYRCAGTGTVTK